MQRCSWTLDHLAAEGCFPTGLDRPRLKIHQFKQKAAVFNLPQHITPTPLALCSAVEVLIIAVFLFLKVVNQRRCSRFQRFGSERWVEMPLSHRETPARSFIRSTWRRSTPKIAHHWEWRTPRNSFVTQHLWTPCSGPSAKLLGWTIKP